MFASRGKGELKVSSLFEYVSILGLIEVFLPFPSKGLLNKDFFKRKRKASFEHGHTEGYKEAHERRPIVAAGGIKKGHTHTGRD